MAETVIFTEQTIASTEFSVYPTTGKYTAFINPAPFVPEVGMTYRVVWDGVEYTCAAQDAGALIDGATFIGDATLFELAGNNEPFIIGGQATSPMNVVALNDTEATEHTVAISQVVEDPEGIVLKDRNGNDVAYYGIETVTFDTTTEGKQQTYTKGVAVEGLEIVPDFSSGDMSVTADDNTLIKSVVIKSPAETASVPLSMTDGDMVITPSASNKLLSSVTVTKPETLIPENIAEGVDIAGIIGTLAAGAIVATGTIPAGTKATTITHGLGVVPDIIFVSPPSTDGANCLHFTMAISKALASRLGKSGYSITVYTNSSGTLTKSFGQIASYTTDGLYGWLSKANAETFSTACSSSLTSIAPSSDATWYAIGGLT